MNLLAIDTTSDKLAIALSVGEKTDFFVGEAGCKRHNSALLTEIDAILARNNTSVAEIDVFGVVVGPGSFTGIRIGVATVNALSLGIGARVVEITSLEQLYDGRDVLVLSDCRHNNFYASLFKADKVEFFSISGAEIETFNCEKVYLEGVYPHKMLEKCLQKAQRGEFCSQARPFYIKDSSAEYNKK